MSMFSTIILKKGKEEAIRRFHPWVFSGAIHKIVGSPIEGDFVKVLTSQMECIAVGHYGSGSIAVRIIAFEDVELNNEFWISKF